MTVERKFFSDGKIVERRKLIPGYEETIHEPPWMTRVIVEDLSVKSDDDIEIRYVEKRVTDYSSSVKVLRTTTLSKHEINNHTIRTDRSGWRRHKYAEFGWVPSKLHISPEQEKIIRELVKDGTYTEEDAEEVRDQMLYELQQRLNSQAID